jgi:hypothetical protein
MVARSPTLAPLLECLKEGRSTAPLNASFRPLSGKPKGKHGLNMSGLIGDEIHEWPNGRPLHLRPRQRRRAPPAARIPDLHRRPEGHARRGGLEGMPGDPGRRHRRPRTLVVIYAPDEDDDWTRRRPGARPTRTSASRSSSTVPGRLQARAAAAAPRERLQALPPQHVDRAGGPLAADRRGRRRGPRFGWDHCIGPDRLERSGYLEASELKGKTCFGGLDLSAIIDLSALVWWFPVQEGLDVPAVLPRFFKPAIWSRPTPSATACPTTLGRREGALFDHARQRRRLRLHPGADLRDAEQLPIAFTGDSEARAEGRAASPSTAGTRPRRR